MLDLNKEYWENRTKEKGHTGWSDPIIYSYDQKIRLNTVKYILKSLSIRGGEVLWIMVVVQGIFLFFYLNFLIKLKLQICQIMFLKLL